MSEIINNREHRQKVLKELIMELHEGQSVDEVKERFATLIEGVSAAEISEMEQALIKEGLPIEEVQRLCDVHTEVFKGSIEEIHRDKKLEDIPGHPLHTFKIENEAIKDLIENDLTKKLESFKKDGETSLNHLKQSLNELWDIDKHYKRKENLIFPYLDKYGITGPPKVMWGVDDEIRRDLKDIHKMIQKLGYSITKEDIVCKVKEVSIKIKEMIFKEENILFPMAIDTLNEDQWVNIVNESDEIGYCLVEPKEKWVPKRADLSQKEENIKEGYVKFETGILSFKEVSTIFNALPVDITFIDKDDVVRYFSQTKERLFVRTKAVIGRTVQNCHPPASVHVVNKMLDDFKSGEKDHEDFWIKMGDKYVYIRYFALRDEAGNYVGTMEVTQNIGPIQAIEGEKRLLS